jgi:ribosomal protein L1
MVNAMVERINSTVRIRVKEPSIKVPVAKESMKDEDIIKNCISVYHKILESLPRQKDNVRNIKIKLTMNKPVNVEI